MPRPFVKGDPRINRKGRPKNYDSLRKLILQILSETVSSQDGTIAMSRIEFVLRDWLASRDYRKQLAVIQYAYGKPPDRVELTGRDGGAIEINGRTDDLDHSLSALADAIGAILSRQDAGGQGALDASQPTTVGGTIESSG